MFRQITKSRENGQTPSAGADAGAEKGMLPMDLGGAGIAMNQPKDVSPLARSVGAEALDWDHIDPKGMEFGKDVLGLTPADRQALGLSAPRSIDLQAPTLGGAETALAEILARGGAMGTGKPRRQR